MARQKKGKYILPRSVPKGLMYKIMHESKNGDTYGFSYNRIGSATITIRLYVLENEQVKIIAEYGKTGQGVICPKNTFLINQEYARIRKDIIRVYLNARLYCTNTTRKG